MNKEILDQMFCAIEDEKLSDNQRIADIQAGIKAIAASPSNKFSLDMQDEKQRTLLTYAAQKSRAQIVDLLLKNGASPKTLDGKHKSTALMFAAQAGCVKTVSFLLEAKADPNTRHEEHSDWGSSLTALAFAIKGGHSAVVQLLLEAKADPNLADKNGNTALAAAAAAGDTQSAGFLLEAKADLHTQNLNGDTPLLWATHNGHTENMRLLLEAKADPNIPDKNGDTPLIWAARRGHIESARLLLEAKADPNIPNKDGDTPLLWAAHNGHTENVRLLLEAKADPNIPDKNGETPFLFATLIGHTKAARLLLAAGANPNTLNKNGDTPLIIAAATGNVQSVGFLLEAKADLHTQNLNGETALHIAVNPVTKDNLVIVALLLMHGVANKKTFFMLCDFLDTQDQTDANTATCLAKLLASPESNLLNADVRLYIQKLNGLHLAYHTLCLWLVDDATRLTIIIPEVAIRLILEYATHGLWEAPKFPICCFEPHTVDLSLSELKSKAENFRRQPSPFLLLSVFSHIREFLELKTTPSASAKSSKRSPPSSGPKAGKGPTTRRHGIG